MLKVNISKLFKQMGVILILVRYIVATPIFTVNITFVIGSCLESLELWKR